MWLFRMQRTAAAVASRAGYFPEFPSESGTQMNLRSDIVAPSAGRKKASSILQHTIIRIPRPRDNVSSQFSFAAIAPRLSSCVVEKSASTLKNWATRSWYRSFGPAVSMVSLFICFLSVPFKVRWFYTSP